MATKLIKGDPTFREGHTYRARATVMLPCSPEELEFVSDQLDSLGFDDIVVAIEPPSTWPADQRAEPPTAQGECPLFVQARWPLPDQSFRRALFGTPAFKVVALWDVSDEPSRAQGRFSAQDAARVLDAAWKIERPNEALSQTGRQMLLAIGQAESGLLKSKYANGQPVGNNWGSIHCPGQPGNQRETPRADELWSHCVQGVDRNKHGSVHVKFRDYLTPLHGARDFVRVVGQFVTSAQLNAGDARDVAVAMGPPEDGRARYYGQAKGESVVDAQNRYTKGIVSNARSVARQLGESQLVEDGGAGTGSSAVVKLLLLFGLAYGVSRGLARGRGG